MSPEAKLNLIERQLRQSDPQFVADWERRASTPRRSTPRDLVPIVVSACLIVTAAALLGFGMLTVDNGLVQGAGVVALCLPVAWLVGAARRSRGSSHSVTSLNPRRDRQ